MTDIPQIPDGLRRTGVRFIHQDGMTPEQARREMVVDMGLPEEKADLFLQWHRATAEAHDVMSPPEGVSVLRWRVESEGTPWAVGEQPGTDIFWPALLPSLQAKVGEEAAAEIGAAADEVLKACADPVHHGHTRRGLVVGYVQSGKTANYTSLIAKAADAGYRGFIVLGGIHNALRAQTQARLVKDLVEPSRKVASALNSAPGWEQLTTVDNDFDPRPNGAALVASHDLRLLAVVKKNATRLRRLRDWLQDIPDDTRRRWPVLLLDDESDQATPNSGAAGKEATTINRLLRDIMGLLPTSTYVGYTATPFANVLIDPAADEDFYPRSFIISLPKPDSYFGAEELFGRGAIDGSDEPIDGFDLIRTVSPDEQSVLRPPSRREDRMLWTPPPTASLRTAVRWFVLATAARRARGHGRFHSSMLVHTTQYAQVHLDQAEVIRTLAADLATAAPADETVWRELWSSEMSADLPPVDDPVPTFDAVFEQVPDVLRQLRVIVDNSLSDERLDYAEEEEIDGELVEVPQTVIAVGGNTLSRGLTLEGLCVSYFVRSAGAYDSLLQMGRWFGYRPGYADLARVWMPDELNEKFRFLSSVEQEIREDINRYAEGGQLGPLDVGVRIRRHPDLAITSRARMQHAVSAEISYAGKRRQTFLFEHTDSSLLRNNIAAAHRLVSRAREVREPEHLRDARWLLRDVETMLVHRFLREYSFHPDQPDLDGVAINRFLSRWADQGHPVSWNVAILGSSRTHTSVLGRRTELGVLDLGLDRPVGNINRSALKRVESLDHVNIGALMSPEDVLADVDPEGTMDPRAVDWRDERADRAGLTGLLALYPISRRSGPDLYRGKEPVTRKPLEATEDIVGVGLVFPQAPAALSGTRLDSDYVTVDLDRLADEHFEVEEDSYLAHTDADTDAASE